MLSSMSSDMSKIDFNNSFCCQSGWEWIFRNNIWFFYQKFFKDNSSVWIGAYFTNILPLSICDFWLPLKICFFQGYDHWSSRTIWITQSTLIYDIVKFGVTKHIVFFLLNDIGILLHCISRLHEHILTVLSNRPFSSIEHNYLECKKRQYEKLNQYVYFIETRRVLYSYDDRKVIEGETIISY